LKARRLSSAHSRRTRRSNQFLKQRLGERVAEHALGVPLYAHDPVAVPGPFHRFNHAIGRMRGDAQAASWGEDRLMVRAIDLSRGPHTGLSSEGGKLRARLYTHGVVLVRAARRPAVLDACVQSARDVL